MPGFKGIKEVVDAETSGKTRSYWWRKTPSAATTIGIWFDLATAGGHPKAKNWFDAAPLTAKAIYNTVDGGFYHGSDTSPEQKHLRTSLVIANAPTALPMQMILCDYLLYYPTIDDSVLEPQEMDNTVKIPRYEDGIGVQMMAVTLSARTGGQTFVVSYTNEKGESGRTSMVVAQNNSGVIGSITTSFYTVNVNGTGTPFIGLQGDDKGVRSVESVTMLNPDTGLFAIVLVKPIAETLLRGIDAPMETDYLMMKSQLPRIYANAFLNYLCLPAGSLAATTLVGNNKVIWN